LVGKKPKSHDFGYHYFCNVGVSVYGVAKILQTVGPSALPRTRCLDSQAVGLG